MAVTAGVDILDLKEPARGPLAPTAPEVWRSVAEQLRQRQVPTSLSAALGEPAEAIRVAEALPAEFRFAKAGPSGCRTGDQLDALWRALQATFSPTTELVAVAYADHDQARSLTPESIFQRAAACGLRHCLVDTFVKDGRSIFDHLPRARLRQLLRSAAADRLWVAIAGSLKLADVSRLLDEGVCPDCFAVRGDVCQQGRESGLCPQKMTRWRTVLAGCQRLGSHPRGC